MQNFIPIYQQIWILQIFSNFSRFLHIIFTDVAHAVDASFGNVKMTLKSVLYLTTSICCFYEMAVNSQSEKSHVQILHYTSDDKHRIHEALSHISCIAILNVKL